MKINRRDVIRLAGAACAGSLLPRAGLSQQAPPPAAPARPEFHQDWSALHHPCPEWFRDAKFGIYFHWGVYSVPAFGNEWYPHNMYLPGKAAYAHQVATYGPLSRFGYKDFIPRFTGEKWNPDALVSLCAAAGARYVGPVAEHADGFSMWNSAVNPYNSVRMGPRRDVVADVARAARTHGLKFMTSFHHQWLWGWYASPVLDADIYQPANAAFYWPHKYDPHGGAFAYTNPHPAPSPRFCRIWRNKVLEVVDRHHPDLIYFDTRADIIAEPYRRDMLENFYTQAERRGQAVVMTYKEDNFPQGTGVFDIEAGQMPGLAPFPWQTDDVLDWKSWGYIADPDYKSSERIIHQLVDVVAKNGNLLLDVGPGPDGTLAEGERQRLAEIGRWLSANGEGIYGTRPWLVYGEGPTRIRPGSYVADHTTDFGPEDIRFTSKADSLYIFVLGWPQGELRVRSLPAGRQLWFGKPRQLEMLATGEKLRWKQDDSGMQITLPGRKQKGTFALKLT